MITVPHKFSFASIRPEQTLDLLTQREMASLAMADQATHRLFRQCALAVLNTGSDIDDPAKLYADYRDFEVEVIPQPRGLKLELRNAPASAFVDGKMIEGIRRHLFSALRDVVFTQHKLAQQQRFDLESGEGITDAVFRILRNAAVVRANVEPRMVVCWGGHAISRVEYEFTKEVGYQLGLRGLDIATGCGPGAMKGPMKGAAIGHAKQFNTECRYLGITEPGIIAAESPNPIVTELVILPDIEKRLEAFLRLAHGILVFPGGVGTAEEIMYLLGIKMHPDNADVQLPVIFTAPEGSADYFQQIDHFLRNTLGEGVTQHYDIICGDPAAVARRMKKRLKKVRRQRVDAQESFSFNWGLNVPEDMQWPFEPNHDNMAALALHREQPVHQLISELRKAFSGLVAGNVKEEGVRAVAEHGPFQLSGEAKLVASLAELLESFVRQGRMKIEPESYRPCFEIGDST